MITVQKFNDKFDNNEDIEEFIDYEHTLNKNDLLKMLSHNSKENAKELEIEQINEDEPDYKIIQCTKDKETISLYEFDTACKELKEVLDDPKKANKLQTLDELLDEL